MTAAQTVRPIGPIVGGGGGQIIGRVGQFVARTGQTVLIAAHIVRRLAMHCVSAVGQLVCVVGQLVTSTGQMVAVPEPSGQMVRELATQNVGRCPQIVGASKHCVTLSGHIVTPPIGHIVRS